MNDGDGEDINDDDDNHPGRQKDVQPVRDRNGKVAVRFNLAIVLTPIVHLRFIIISVLGIIIVIAVCIIIIPLIIIVTIIVIIVIMIMMMIGTSS